MSNISFPIAQVVWTDAAFCSYGPPKSVVCNSVGYLIYKDKEELHLAMDINEMGPRDILVVPSAYVNKVRIVENDSVSVQQLAVEVKKNAPNKRPSRRRR